MPNTRTKLNVKKEINYLGRDFSSLRNNLIDFAKIYFPNEYNDFNETSPGMMFIEMASYVGDVLSYYVDSQFKEMLLGYAEQRRNVITLSETLGYFTKPSIPAVGTLSVFQTVISDNTDPINPKPDLRYGLTINEGMEVKSSTNSQTRFRTLQDVNFKYSSNLDPLEVSVFETDGNKPTKWLLKKTVPIQAGNKKTEEFSFGKPEQYVKITLPENDVIDIISCVDSDGNNWYEVPYLAQETVFEEIANVAENDSELSQFNETAPYLLRLKKTARRFTVRVRSDNKTELQFGAGVSNNPDEEIIPNPSNIGGALSTGKTLTESFDPTNILYTKTYGQVPNNTTLTITYTFGGGLNSNVGQGDLVNISSINFNDDGSNVLVASTYSDAKLSVAVTNDEPTTGGRGEETTEEIRQNALANFPTQLRAVTKEDYIVRAYSLPPKFGNIAKAYIVQDEQLNQADNVVVTTNSAKPKEKFDPIIGDAVEEKPVDKNPTDFTGVNNAGLVKPPMEDNRTNQGPARIPNPLALNMYVLGYDADKYLTKMNKAVKNNLKTYIGQYRMLTDAINIKDAYIINIGIDFEITTLKNYNKREVVLRCVEKIRQFFEIDKWQINQPIEKSDLVYDISLVEGVRSVLNVDIINKFKSEDGYSGNVYDIKEATRDNVVYTSADPSIFELKYYQKDIRGRAS